MEPAPALGWDAQSHFWVRPKPQLLGKAPRIQLADHPAQIPCPLASPTTDSPLGAKTAFSLPDLQHLQANAPSSVP